MVWCTRTHVGHSCAHVPWKVKVKDHIMNVHTYTHECITHSSTHVPNENLILKLHMSCVHIHMCTFEGVVHVPT